MDIYQPTKCCLGLIEDRLTKGSLLGFDEVNNQTFPGETTALMEAIGLPNLRLERLPNTSNTCYAVVD